MLDTDVNIILRKEETNELNQEASPSLSLSRHYEFWSFRVRLDCLFTSTLHTQNIFNQNRTKCLKVALKEEIKRKTKLDLQWIRKNVVMSLLNEWFTAAFWSKDVHQAALDFTACGRNTHISYLKVKVLIPQCRNTLSQVKVLNSNSVFSESFRIKIYLKYKSNLSKCSSNLISTGSVELKTDGCCCGGEDSRQTCRKCFYQQQIKAEIRTFDSNIIKSETGTIKVFNSSCNKPTAARSESPAETTLILQVLSFVLRAGLCPRCRTLTWLGTTLGRWWWWWSLLSW